MIAGPAAVYLVRRHRKKVKAAKEGMPRRPEEPVKERDLELEEDEEES